MSVFELAKMYYPRLWDDRRIDALVEVGKLTLEQSMEIKNGYQDRMT